MASNPTSLGDPSAASSGWQDNSDDSLAPNGHGSESHTTTNPIAGLLDAQPMILVGGPDDPEADETLSTPGELDIFAAPNDDTSSEETDDSLDESEPGGDLDQYYRPQGWRRRWTVSTEFCYCGSGLYCHLFSSREERIKRAKAAWEEGNPGPQKKLPSCSWYRSTRTPTNTNTDVPVITLNTPEGDTYWLNDLTLYEEDSGYEGDGEYDREDSSDGDGW